MRIPALLSNAGNLFLAVFMIVLHSEVDGQNLRDNTGKEFYVAFGPNTGGEADIETQNAVTLNIVSKKVAKVLIEIPALGYEQTIEVNPGISATVQLPNGNNATSTALLQNSDDEIVVKGRAVHVTSNEDIALFALNRKLYSEDACVVFPVEVLGTEYYAVSYNASFLGQGSAKPGQLIVIALADHTSVTVTPRCRTAKQINALENINIVLDQGDCYLIQSDVTGSEDLTGSRILSDKPIAVFSGHERAAIPSDAKLYDGNPPSRDHLVEQLPPLTACGDSFFVVPFTGTDRPDLLRVISTSDETSVSVNGQQVRTINAGEFYEIKELWDPVMLTTSKPVLAAQYMGTTLGQLNDPNFPANGDPSLMIVVPTEQYMKEYNFHAYGYWDSSTVTVVLPAVAYMDTRLDGIPFDVVRSIPGTDFVFGIRRVKIGLHSVTSSMPVTAYNYGLSGVASFAMPAGMGLEHGGLTKSAVQDKLINPLHMSTTTVTQNNYITLPPVGDQGAVKIYDALGRLVMTQELQVGGSTRIDLRALSKGFYFYGQAGAETVGSFLVH